MRVGVATLAGSEPRRRGIDRSARRAVLAASATAFAQLPTELSGRHGPAGCGASARSGVDLARGERDRSGLQRVDRVSESQCCSAMHPSLTTSKMHKAGLLNLKCTVSDPSLFDKCL